MLMQVLVMIQTKCLFFLQTNTSVELELATKKEIANNIVELIIQKIYA